MPFNSFINDSTCVRAYDHHHEYVRGRASRPYDRVHVHVYHLYGNTSDFTSVFSLLITQHHDFNYKIVSMGIFEEN
jgi:hypothetical protein